MRINGEDLVKVDSVNHGVSFADESAIYIAQRAMEIINKHNLSIPNNEDGKLESLLILIIMRYLQTGYVLGLNAQANLN